MDRYLTMGLLHDEAVRAEFERWQSKGHMMAVGDCPAKILDAPMAWNAKLYPDVEVNYVQ